MSEYPKQIAVIEWEDASASHVDFSKKTASADNYGVCRFVTVGILVHENSKRYILATDYLAEYYLDHENEYRSCLIIPKGWTHSVKKIPLPKPRKTK